MDPLEELNTRHNAEMDALVLEVTRGIEKATSMAAARATAELFSKISVTDGKVDRTPRNLNVIRSTERVLLAELDASGYERVIERFVNSFTVQIPWFQQILHQLSKGIGEDLAVKFTKADMQVFGAQQIVSLDQLKSQVEDGAARAKQKALFSVAGLPLSELSVIISEQMSATAANVESLADTALPGFYRTIADRGYEHIEDGLNDQSELRLGYYGPLDKLNREFCRREEERAKAGATYTREEIDRMNNGKGQPKPVRIFCGGWRCRHQWIVREIRRRAAR